MQKKSPPPEKFLCQTAPSALRNASPILRVLRDILPEKCSVLEIGSGTGQHSVIFSEGINCLKWIPSDVDASNFESINEWAQTATNNIPTSPR
jgi:protein-L-isoaspartate O-methyltransferase